MGKEDTKVTENSQIAVATSILRCYPQRHWSTWLRHFFFYLDSYCSCIYSVNPFLNSTSILIFCAILVCHIVFCFPFADLWQLEK